MAPRSTKRPRVPLAVQNPMAVSGTVIQVNHCRMPDCGNYGVPARTTPVKTGPSDDRDWFAVELTGGRAYRVDLEGSPTDQGTLDDPYLRGIYFDRKLLPGTADDDGGEGYNSRLDFSAPGTATYYIAAAAHAAHTGSYRLSVEEVADDYPATTATGAVVQVGGSATGEIETPGDTDWFAVELSAGREYLIDLEGWRTDGGTLDDPVLPGIYDVDGTLIDGATDDDGGEGLNSRVSFEAPETGTYYIAAGAYED